MYFIPQPYHSFIIDTSRRWLSLFLPYAILLVIPPLLEFTVSLPNVALVQRAAAALLAAAWLALGTSLLPQRLFGLALRRGVTSVVFVLVSIEVVHFVLFRRRANDSVFLAITNSHLAEVKEFITTYLGGYAVYVVLGIGGGISIWALLRQVGTSIALRAPRWMSVIGTASSLFALGGFAYVESGILSVVSRTSLAPTILIAHYREATKAQRQLLASTKQSLFPDAASRRFPAQQTYVLLLGESTARGHLGLYGYPRDTTPRLARLKDDLVVFENVLSPHSHTPPAVRAALGFTPPDESNPFEIMPSVIDLMKAAGFKTYWISNQVAFGRWNTPVAFLAKRAHVVQFLNPEQFRFDAYSYDEVVLDPLEKALRDFDPLKFIVVHLRGAHAEYSRRYPPSFPAFSDSPPTCSRPLTPEAAQRVNEYDTAVKYQDSIAASAIELVKEHSPYSAVAFMSDHGEELYDFRDFAGHNEATPSSYMFEIPLMVWTSVEYQRENGSLLKAARAHSESPYNMGSFAHTLQELTGVSGGRFRAEESLLSAQLKPQRDRIILGIPFPDEARNMALICRPAR